MKHTVIAALVAISGLAAPASAQQRTVKAGIEAWQRSDYATAVSIWRPLAESGNADAAFNLGQAYRLGRGVQVNLAAAQTWLERAARKDHLDAQSTLGLLLFQNGNHAAGLRWLKAAAEGGDPRALLVYGTALFNGDGVERDPVLAYAYVSRAAAQGLAPAKSTLAEMDKAIPLAQRQQGVALALNKARTSGKSTAPARNPTPPARPNANVVAPATAAGAGGPWRIQLGAFAQRGSAEALFRRLAANPSLTGKRPFLIPAGQVTRLQVGPFPTRAAAAAACAVLKGQACFPVAAR